MAFIKFEPGMKFKLIKTITDSEGIYEVGTELSFVSIDLHEYEMGGEENWIRLKEPVSGNYVYIPVYEIDEFLEFLT